MSANFTPPLSSSSIWQQAVAVAGEWSGSGRTSVRGRRCAWRPQATRCGDTAPAATRPHLDEGFGVVEGRRKPGATHSLVPSPVQVLRGRRQVWRAYQRQPARPARDQPQPQPQPCATALPAIPGLTHRDGQVESREVASGAARQLAPLWRVCHVQTRNIVRQQGLSVCSTPQRQQLRKGGTIPHATSRAGAVAFSRGGHTPCRRPGVCHRVNRMYGLRTKLPAMMSLSTNYGCIH